jgi:cell wall-associated NlpC family hydrolase
MKKKPKSLAYLVNYLFLFLVGSALLSSCAIFKKKTKKSTLGYAAVSIARGYIGTPYRSGGIDYKGIDCSGLIIQSLTPLGYKLPRISWQQAEFGKQVDISQIMVGDLVFFVTSKKSEPSKINHAGIVSDIVDKEVFFIHASTSKGVREDKLFSDYWRQALVKIMRPF